MTAGDHKSLSAEQRSLLKPVFFVTGVMRSGTTLLQRIIAHSCQSEYAKEVDSIHVMVESMEILERYGAFRPLGRDRYVELYRDFLTATLNACAGELFGGTLVLKDPLALRTLKLFRELVPEVKFLISVRNPLDTVTDIPCQKSAAAIRQRVVRFQDGFRRHRQLCLDAFRHYFGFAAGT